MAANRKILIATAMLLVSLFASISVTFAWFSTSTQASAIFTLTLRDEDDNLFVRVDGGIDHERVDDYGRRVELVDLDYTSKHDGWRLRREDGNIAIAASYVLQQYTLYTDNPLKSVYFGVTESKVTSDNISIGFSGPENATWYSKDYWLRDGPTNERIAQFYGTTDISATDDPSATVIWRAGQPDETVYYYNSGGMYDTNAANAVRVMTFEGGHDTLPNTAPIHVWAPNANEGYDAKNADGEYLYEQVSSYHRNSMLLKENKSVPVDRDDPYNQTEYTASGADTVIVPSNVWRPVQPSEEDFFAEATYRAKVTVVMWLEGRDADCFNVISSKTINADFKFVLV